MRGDNEITGNENTLSGRDIIDRVDYLTDERETLESEIDEAIEAAIARGAKAPRRTKAVKAEIAALREWEEDNGDELKGLESVSEQIGRDSYLVADDYFENYARDYHEQTCSSDAKRDGWPYNCIDWTRAARELQIDFSCVEVRGNTFYYSG